MPIDKAISDHDSTYIEIDCRFNLSKCVKRVVWDYKHGVYEHSKELISKVNTDIVSSVVLRGIILLTTSVLTLLISSLLYLKNVYLLRRHY
jgi:hypothetical protein